MKVLLNLCLIFSLISPVLLLTCKKCLATRGTECSKELNQNCISKSSCRNTIFSSDVFINITMAQKSCTPLASCQPGEYSITTSGGRFMKMLVDCCTKYNCNSKPLEFSSEPMEPNGLECEGCDVQSQGLCSGAKKVKCLGDQTKCINMKIYYILFGTTEARIFNTKGCATPLMCDNEKVNKNMDLRKAGVNKVKVNCTDAILPPSVSSLA